MNVATGFQTSFSWETSASEQSQPASHKVYFVEAVSTGLVKIGWTSNLEKRLYALRRGNAVELVLLKCIPGDRAVEAALHRRFRAYRVRGEWFRVDPLRSDIDALTGNIPTLVKCRDCGAVLMRDRGMQCRVCAGLHRRALTRAAAERRATCRECGRALSLKTVLKGVSTGLCRGCGMRSAWARPDYQASIMAARAAAGVRRRRKCERCGEPLRARKGGRFHPECWAALIRSPVDVRQQPLHGVA